MEEYLSERVKNLATSQTLAMAAKARELKTKGIISLLFSYLIGLSS